MRLRTKQRLKTIALILVPVLCVCAVFFLKKDKQQAVITQDKIAPVEELTLEQKIEDFEYLHSFVEENYPLLKVNKRVNGVDWSSEKENFKKLIENTQSDAAFVGEIERIIQRLNDSSTIMISDTMFKSFYAGYTNPEYADKYKEEIPIITNPITLKRYRFDESQVKIVEDLYDNKIDRLSNIPDFKTDVILENEVAYLDFKSMNYDRLEEDGEIIRKFLEEVKDYKKLIIDVRQMSWWNIDIDEYWIKNIVEPLLKEEKAWDKYAVRKGDYGQKFQAKLGTEFYPIKELSNKISNEEIITEFDYYTVINETIKSVNPIDFKGEVYIITDKKSIIIAENFAAFAKDTGFAIVIGEETTHYDYDFPNIIFSLPNSGLIVTMRDMLYLNNDGSIRYEVNVKPDIKVNTTKGSTYERDEAIQYIINN